MKLLNRNLAIFGFTLGMGFPLFSFADGAVDFARTNGPVTLEKDDITFFDEAAQIDLTELQAATIARNRGLTSETKEFAGHMTTDHSENISDLHSLAAKKGVTPPNKLDAKHQGELNNLQKIDANKFDSAYADAMDKGHKAAIALYEKTSKNSKDADVRSFAMNKLPILRQHLDMAKHLSDKSPSPLL